MLVNERQRLRDRYQGTLVASAAGDALGATLEFMSRDEIRRQYGVLRDIVGGGWLNLAPGAVTDDTQMMLCIARSIVAQGGFDGEDIADRFLDWYHSNPPDIGTTTRHALEQLARGVSWNDSGLLTHRALRPRDASNGSIMRCAPVALHARADSVSNAESSAISSRITHANPLCVAGCIALNGAIAALLTDPQADVVTIVRDVVDDELVRETLALAPEKNPSSLRVSGYVLDTLEAAFWALTNHDSLEEAIIAGVNLGNDADTTGAVTGALAGAKWGYSAIPERWLAVLHGRDELIELADRLLDLSTNQAPVRHSS